MADGTVYSYYRTRGPVAFTDAEASCDAAGGKLASLESPEQVNLTLWHREVVDAAAEQSEPALLWTGFKITWTNDASNHRHRRMLRSASAFDNDANGPGAGGADADADAGASYAALLQELQQHPDAVPARTSTGTPIPELVRVHMLEYSRRTARSSSSSGGQQQQPGGRGIRSRSLLRFDGGTAATSAFLTNAVVSWADGASPDMILGNTANLGFLACSRKPPTRPTECCGAVFDIGPDAYPGSDFPAMFMYPCEGTQFSTSMAPAGYMCVEAPVAELPGGEGGGGGATGTPVPNPNTGRTCRPGMQPVTTAGRTQCKQCKRNTYSADGVSCRRCPSGTSAPKGSTVCA